MSKAGALPSVFSAVAAAGGGVAAATSASEEGDSAELEDKSYFVSSSESLEVLGDQKLKIRKA